jgi:hypothetical protein
MRDLHSLAALLYWKSRVPAGWPISGDLKVGGRYQFEGNAGGTITRCDRPARIESTWEMHGQASWVTVTLTPEGDGTRLELEHVAHVPDEMWAQFGPGAVDAGWDARAASDGWGEASIADGTPADEARAAAELTRQFYTGDTGPES